MFYTITISNAMWGYLQNLYNMQIRDKSLPFNRAYTCDKGHKLQPSGDLVFPGETSTYGRIRPWEDIPEEQIPKDWRDHECYYVAMSEGTRDGRPLLSTGINAGSFYPERVFTWGEDEEGVDLTPMEIMRHMEAVGFWKRGPSFWEPCLVWRGYARGMPTWNQALRANTDMGIRWHDVLSTLGRDKLPRGYSWDQMPGTQYGLLYFDTDDVEEEVP